MKSRKKKIFTYASRGAIVTATILSTLPMNVLTTHAVNTLEKDEIVWQTSFEEANFKENTVDSKKGSSNIKGFTPEEKIKGDVSQDVLTESIEGSRDHNNNETKDKLFDSNSGSKWLTNANVPSIEKHIYVQFAFKNAIQLDRYGVVSANDADERDPKNWIFYGSTDNQNWVKIDEQSQQTFEKRFEKKEFQIASPQEYQYYKLEITANHGNVDMTQFADLLLGTGKDKDQTQSSQMITKISKGPTEAWNQSANTGWSGKKALEVSGQHIGTSDAHSWNVLYDNLDIKVNENTALSYVVFPGLADGDYDYHWTQMNVAVDLKFSDGSYLSEYQIYDTNGNLLTPQGQGDSRTLTTNQWNKITARLGSDSRLQGKTIKEVLVAYDNKDNKSDKDVNFLDYFDDIKIYNEALHNYDNNNLAEYVNILRGTNDSPNFSRGLTAPAVTMPHGFNFFAPVTNSGDNKLYTYQQNGNVGTLKHMTISHEPSYWVGDRGNWEFMVNTSIDPNSNQSIGSNERAAVFSHDNETAKAHYYGVEFNEGNAKGAKMELSPTMHGASVKFTYDKDAKYHNVILDLVRNGKNKNVTLNTDKKSFTAQITPENSNGMKTMYVYGEFNTEWTAERYGNDSKNSAIVSFDGTNEVEMQVATSFISFDQAKKNLDLELTGKSFETVYNEARKVWNDKLDVITVEATHEQKVTLYSNLYRLFAYPNLLSENTGTNENPVWQYKSTVGDEVKTGTLYYNNGFWDTYHTTWAGYQLLTPSKYEEMLNGLVEHYNDGEWVPRWVAPGGTNSMVGTSSDVIFADAAVKGADFDLETAYKSAIKNAAVVNIENLTKGGRAELNTSIFRGYTSNSTGEGFSWSMEGYINDYGISQMAALLAQKAEEAGKIEEAQTYKDEAAYYRNRALNYVNLFDGTGEKATDKWFKGKNANGDWSQGDTFDPTFWGNDYTETDAYNMTVTVPQDGNGLANLYGGYDALAERMDSIFTTKGTYNGYNAINGVGGIHEQREAREVKLGQYGHSNQPSHGIIYMYNFAKQPWKTQQYVRDVLKRCYVGSDFGQGYLGDEDNGEMSGWYILSALGFFPVTMGSGQFAIGSPLYTKATIHLENGKDLTITANNNSDENVYVQSMKVNGEDYNSSFIDSSVLSSGGKIEFNMGSTPNKNWGLEGDGGSLTKGSEVANPEEDLTVASLDVSDKVAIDVNKDTVSGQDVKDIKNLFDNDSNSFATFKDETSIYYSFMRPVKVNMLTLTSTKDQQKDAPNQFVLLGSNDGENWTEIKNQTNIEFEWGRYTRPFSIDNKDQGYHYYRIDFKAGTTLSEIELIGQADDTSSIDKTLLTKVVARAQAIDQTDMSTAVKKLLNDGIDAAQKVLNDENATQDKIVEQYTALSALIKRVENVRDGLVRIEAETFNKADSEIKNDGNNIGGVKKKTWVGYNDVNFETAPNKLTVNYSAQDSDACGNGEIQVRLDTRDGEPLFTLNTHKTGGWDKYKVHSVDIPEEVQAQFVGLHDVYFSFEGNDPIDEKMVYVANVDYFEFSKAVVISAKANGEGTITTTDTSVQYGQDFQLEFIPNEGYKAIKVIVNGKELEGYIPGTNEITLKNLKENTNIEIEFAQDTDFTINEKSSSDEIALTINDKDGNAVTNAKAGDQVFVQVTNIPEDKVLDKILVNNQEIHFTATYDSQTVYTGSFYMPYGDVVIETVISALPTYDLEVKDVKNGQIEVVGHSGNKVIEGKDLVVTLTPDKEYKVAQLTINGKEVEVTIDDNGVGTYIVKNVTSGIVISAEFIAERDTKILEALVKQGQIVLESVKGLNVDTTLLEKAINNAQKVINDQTLTQSTVDNAIAQMRVELARMNIALYVSENKDLSTYTDDTVSHYKDVIAQAKELINQDEINLEELEAMINELNKAESQLKVKEPVINDDTDKDPDKDNQNDNQNNNQNDNKNDNSINDNNQNNDNTVKSDSVVTEDSTLIKPYGLTLLAGLLGFIVLTKKRKNRV